MMSTETSDDTVSARSTSSSTEGFARDQESTAGGGDVLLPNLVAVKPLKLEKIPPKNSRLTERRCIKKPKKLAAKSGLTLKQNNNTKIPKLSLDNTTENLGIASVSILKKLHSPRYYTAARKSFAKHKSLSQMNIREARNHLKMNSSVALKQRSKDAEEKNMPDCTLKSCIVKAEHKYEQAMEMNSSFYQMMRLNGNTDEEQMAGMKIFATVILNAWRKRRDEVKLLNEEIARLKKASIKMKNQIHVLNSMFKIEQKQNDDLSSRLKRMTEEQHKLQTSYDGVMHAYKEEIDKSQTLQDRIENKERELEALDFILTETKAELFQSMARERSLDRELSMEQRKVQELENSKNELYSQLIDVKADLFEKQSQIKQMTLEENQLVSSLYENLDILENKMKAMEKNENHYRSLIEIEASQKKQIEALNMDVNILKNQIESTLVKRAKNLVYGKSSIPYFAFKIVHLLTFLLLPAVSPPLKTEVPSFDVLQKKIGFKFLRSGGIV